MSLSDRSAEELLPDLSRLGPKPDDQCPSKKKRRWAHGEDDAKALVTMEAEADFGMMWPQAKECLEPSEAGKDKGFSLRVFAGNVFLLLP